MSEAFTVSDEPDTGSCPPEPNHAENSKQQEPAIKRLFKQVHNGYSEVPVSGDEAHQSEAGDANADPSAINRIFDRVATHNRLSAISPAEARQFVAHITHHDIKAMKVVSNTAESKPEVLVQKQWNQSVQALWSDMTRYFYEIMNVRTK